MKKALCLVIAVIMCMAFVFAGCQNNDTPGGYVVDHSTPENYATADKSDTPVKSDIKIEEGETVSVANIGAETEIFFGSKYYLEGTIYTGKEKLPVKLATDGANLELTATVSNLSLAILILDEQSYVVNSKAMSYTELSDMLVKMLEIDSLDVSGFQNMPGEDANEQASIVQNAVTINGESGLCTDYVYNDTSIKLYSIGDKLVQMENFDEKGNLTMQIVIDSITDQIPSDQLTLKGLTRQNLATFISSFASGI